MKCRRCQAKALPGYDGLCTNCWLEYEDWLDKPISQFRDCFGGLWERIARTVRNWWAK